MIDFKPNVSTLMISRNRSVWDHHDLRHKTLGFHVELNVTVSRSISVLVLFHEPPESGNLKQQHKIHPTLLIGLHFRRNMIAKWGKNCLCVKCMHLLKDILDSCIVSYQHWGNYIFNKLIIFPIYVFSVVYQLQICITVAVSYHMFVSP